eukprot:scaffold7052_cov254-Pinguiococcus_pyrenoidosus.AAC.59
MQTTQTTQTKAVSLEVLGMTVPAGADSSTTWSRPPNHSFIVSNASTRHLVRHVPAALPLEAGFANVHHGDGLGELRRLLDQPESRQGAQRSAHDQQPRALDNRLPRPLSDVLRHDVSEERDVRLERASATARTLGHSEGVVHLLTSILQRSIAIGADLPRASPAVPAFVEALQVVLERPARHVVAAGQATEAVVPTVQVHHGLGAGLLVQAIHILSHDGAHVAASLQAFQGHVPVVGLRRAERPPACHAPRPILLLLALVEHEGVVAHGAVALAVASCGAAVVRNARFGADARAA